MVSEEEKNKKREFGKNRYCNMSKEKKTKIKRVSKKLSLKCLNIIINKIFF